MSDNHLTPSGRPIDIRESKFFLPQRHAKLGCHQNPELFDVVNGTIPVPSGPGLGVEINEALVRKEASEALPWRNPVSGVFVDM